MGLLHFLFFSFLTRSHYVICPFWFCPYILVLFPNILPLVIWPTFYLRILPSSVSLNSSRFSQVCLVILILFSLCIKLVCVYAPHIISLRKRIALFAVHNKTKPIREQISVCGFYKAVLADTGLRYSHAPSTPCCQHNCFFTELWFRSGNQSSLKIIQQKDLFLFCS